MAAPLVLSVHIGQIAPLGPNAVPSGFVKRPVAAAVHVTTLGLAGDEQADLRVHGGLEKAVYGYSVGHYAAWRSEYPHHGDLLVPSGFGENLAVEAMSEADLCVGDVHAIGSTLLQVCQPRQPCFKFALRFNDNSLPRAMVKNGRAGWYYRVLQTGAIAAGDSITLLERPNPDFPFTRLVALAGRANATPTELARMAEMPGLASNWQATARTAMERP